MKCYKMVLSKTTIKQSHGQEGLLAPLHNLRSQNIQPSDWPSGVLTPFRRTKQRQWEYIRLFLAPVTFTLPYEHIVETGTWRTKKINLFNKERHKIHKHPNSITTAANMEKSGKVNGVIAQVLGLPHHEHTKCVTLMKESKNLKTSDILAWI